MKKVLAILIVFVLAGFSMVSGGFSNSTNSTQQNDSFGYDAWLSMLHDSSGSGFSNTRLEAPLEESRQSPFELGASSTAFFSGGTAIHDGIMYVQFASNPRGGSSEVIAIDIEYGEELWRTEVQGRLTLNMCPVVVPELDMVYVSATNGYGKVTDNPKTFITGLSLEEGMVEWETQIAGAVFSAIQYHDEGVFARGMFSKDPPAGVEYTVMSDFSTLTKVNAIDGNIEWTHDLNGGWYPNWDYSFSVKDGKVFASIGNFGQDTAAGMIYFLSPVTAYCIDADTGMELWKRQQDEEFKLTAGMTVDNDYAYFAAVSISETSGATTHVFALEIETGYVEWECKISSISFWSSPVHNSEFVFIATRDGNIHAIDKTNGRRSWNKKIADEIRGTAYAVTEDYLVGAGYAVSNNSITGARVQMIELASRGKTLWRESFDRDMISQVAIYGKGVFFAGEGTGSIYYFESPLPELEVKPERILLGEIERNTLNETTLIIQNKGKPGLEGQAIVSHPEWLSVLPEKIDDQTKELIVTVNTKDLDLRDYRGTVSIQSNGGNKDIPVNFVVVDTTPPTVEIEMDEFVVIEDDYYTNNPNFVLKGTTEATAMLLVQDKEAEIDADGYFEVALDLEEGKNEIVIDATDDVGNQEVSTFVLYLDSKAPVLNITTPNYKLSVDPNDYIMGTVDDLKAEVTINGEAVQLAPNGSFAKMVFLARGVNEFVIQAKDRIGNITEVKHYMVFPEKKLIVLFIGRTNAEINGIPVTLDVPPRIMNGRTMVPLRFVGEAMGAEIEWEGTEQKITFTLFGKQIILRVGASTAMVNGEPVMLDASPTIIGGRTLVPVRFVSENLGAKVDWDGGQQRITITFPAS